MNIQKLEQYFSNKPQFLTPSPSIYGTIWLTEIVYRL